MYLTHLKIAGFKSFAKPGELEFSAPITAIVGPNGSGKSNVAEAFRFVLGEQSLKSMRSKKGEDLIFGGTDGAARANRASVVVTLNNVDRVFPLDFDEITVERVVHRDGQNEYRINGSKVRLKDVHELFAAANIGSTGHHIISQGEADRILSANPKERREMIEDALGLKVYQYKKADALKKLDKTRANIEQVQSLRREVAPHMQFLERQIKKMERAVELRRELSGTYMEYLSREDTYIAFHHDRLNRERQAPVAKLAELETSLAKAKEALASHEHDEKSDDLIKLEEDLAAQRHERSELVRQSGQLEGQCDFLKRRIKEIERIHASESDQPIPAKTVRELVVNLERTAEHAAKSEDPGILKRALTDLVHTAKKFLQTTLGQSAPDTSREEKEFEDIEKQVSALSKKIEACDAEEEKLRASYDELREAIEAERSESREAEREIFRISALQRETEGQLASLDAALRTLDRDRDEFKRELQEAVSLLGREASLYYEYVVMDGATPVAPESIVAEGRTAQADRRRALEKLKIRLEELGGVNQDIEKEYREVKERDDFLVREITDLESSVVKLESLIAELTNELNAQFESGVEKIGKEFNSFFTLMFGGGEARLVKVVPKPKKQDDDELLEGELPEVEEEEVVEEGVDLDVKLPNKRVRGLDMLSGGERALTSIALIFAMSQVNPPLFIILDETDAALDEANSRRYGDMIEALAKRSQLILITHNRETMSRAGILYGVTMGGDGISKLLSVKFDEAVVTAKS